MDQLAGPWKERFGAVLELADGIENPLLTISEARGVQTAVAQWVDGEVPVPQPITVIGPSGLSRPALSDVARPDASPQSRCGRVQESIACVAAQRVTGGLEIVVPPGTILLASTATRFAEVTAA